MDECKPLRTGRAGKSGTAITLVSPAEEDAMEEVRFGLAARGGAAGAAAAAELKPFDKLSVNAVEALRQGLKLVHFSDQHKRFVWDRVCIQGSCRGCLESVRGY